MLIIVITFYQTIHVNAVLHFGTYIKGKNINTCGFIIKAIVKIENEIVHKLEADANCYIKCSCPSQHSYVNIYYPASFIWR